MPSEVICVLPKGKTKQNGGINMNEKTRRQIEEMEKQTIGVEVEMNSIKRNKAAKIAAEYFGTGMVLVYKCGQEKSNNLYY